MPEGGGYYRPRNIYEPPKGRDWYINPAEFEHGEKEKKKIKKKEVNGALIYKDKYTEYTYEIPAEIENHFLKLGILHEFMSLTIILNQVYVELDKYLDELSDDVATGKQKLQKTLNRLETLRMDPVVGIKEYYAKKEKYGGPTHNRLSYKIEVTLYATLELLSSMLGTPIFIAKAIMANTLKEMATKKYNDAENNKQENRALLIYNLLNEMFRYNSKFDYTIGGKYIINPFITALPLFAHSNYEIIIRLDNTGYPKILVLDNSIEGQHYSYSWTLSDAYWTLQRTTYNDKNLAPPDFDEGYLSLGTYEVEWDEDKEWHEWKVMDKSNEKYPYLFARIWKRPMGYMINWMETNPFEEEVVFEDYEIENPVGHGSNKKTKSSWGGGKGDWPQYKAEYV
jgi:hypothetical protein